MSNYKLFLSEGKLREMPGKMMKVHSGSRKMKDCPLEVPMSMLNENMALKNHSQTLARLNERGGLGALEILDNINVRRLTMRGDKPEEIELLNQLIKQHLSSLKEYIINPEDWKGYSEGFELQENDFVVEVENIWHPPTREPLGNTGTFDASHGWWNEKIARPSKPEVEKEKIGDEKAGYDLDYWKGKYKEANEFICDIAKLLGEDDLGFDGKDWTIGDFETTIKNYTPSSIKWVKGRDRLPGLFTVVEWRNADGGNIPLGKHSPFEFYNKCGANINFHEWKDEKVEQADKEAG